MLKGVCVLLYSHLLSRSDLYIARIEPVIFIGTAIGSALTPLSITFDGLPVSLPAAFLTRRGGPGTGGRRATASGFAGPTTSGPNFAQHQQDAAEEGFVGFGPKLTSSSEPKQVAKSTASIA